MVLSDEALTESYLRELLRENEIATILSAIGMFPLVTFLGMLIAARLEGMDLESFWDKLLMDDYAMEDLKWLYKKYGKDKLKAAAERMLADPEKKVNAKRFANIFLAYLKKEKGVRPQDVVNAWRVVDGASKKSVRTS